jgi:hypothetical protein
MAIRIVIDNPSDKFRANMAQVRDRIYRAVDIAANMIASMWEQAGRDVIAASGNFGEKWTSGLHVNQDGSAPSIRLYMSHDIPFAHIFETGGTIQGKPLLWIPISGTDAQGKHASQYGDLFSMKYPRRDGGRPLLFSSSDRQPKYFGIESVTIPPKWDLNGTAVSVMKNFQSVFDAAMQQAT